MTHNLDATVFVYRNHKDKTIKAEYIEKAQLLEDSPDWDHIATLEPRIWIEFHYDTVEKANPDAKQEPVAWLVEFENGEQEFHFEEQAVGESCIPLYTTPPQRTWVGLTKDEIREVIDKFENDNGHVQAVLSFVRAIEAKLKEKNT